MGGNPLNDCQGFDAGNDGVGIVAFKAHFDIDIAANRAVVNLLKQMFSYGQRQMLEPPFTVVFCLSTTVNIRQGGFNWSVQHPIF